MPSFEALLFWITGGGTAVGVILAFLLAAGLVVAAGTKLSVYGDALGERTGLGQGLVGLLFLAAVTSLPELVVSTTSTIAASLKAIPAPAGPETTALYTAGADLAIGNMIGSNVFNLMLLVLLDYVQGPGALLHRLSRNHAMSAAGGLWLLGIALFGLALCGHAWGGIGWIIPYIETGPVTPLLFVGYVVVMVLQGNQEKKDDGMQGLAPEVGPETADRLLSMPAVQFYGTLVIFATMIVIGGIWLSLVGDQMAITFGLGQSFVGTIFLAISTSLPELVVSVAAARLGAFNMAAGNVLGSNIFNLVILFTADIGLRGGSLLHYASASHLVTIAMVLMLTATLLIGLVYRSERHALRLGFDCWIMLVIYLLGNFVLYIVGSGTSAPLAAAVEESRPAGVVEEILESPPPSQVPPQP